jgi:hypothetical protein
MLLPRTAPHFLPEPFLVVFLASAAVSLLLWWAGVRRG